MSLLRPSLLKCADDSMHEDSAADLTAGDAVKFAIQLKVKRRTGSRRTLKPAAAQLKPARGPQAPWRGRTLKSDKLQGIDKTVELLNSELCHVQQLPQNSKYARHRQRLLTTALQLAEQQRGATAETCGADELQDLLAQLGLSSDLAAAHQSAAPL